MARVYVVVEVFGKESVIDGVYLKAIHAARSIAGLGIKEPEELVNELVDSNRVEQVGEDGRITAYIEAWGLATWM